MRRPSKAAGASAGRSFRYSWWAGRIDRIDFEHRTSEPGTPADLAGILAEVVGDIDVAILAGWAAGLGRCTRGSGRGLPRLSQGSGNTVAGQIPRTPWLRCHRSHDQGEPGHIVSQATTRIGYYHRSACDGLLPIAAGWVKTCTGAGSPPRGGLVPSPRVFSPWFPLQRKREAD